MNLSPTDALNYLTQLANDYVRTLPPSAAGPTQAVAQDAINALVPLTVTPAEPGTSDRALRAVPDAE